MSHFSEHPGTGNRRPSTVNRQPSTVNRQPATVDRQPATVDRQPATGNRFLSPLLQVSLKYKGQVQLAINIGMTAHPVQRTNPTIGNLVYWYNGKSGYNPIPSTNRRILRSLHRDCGVGIPTQVYLCRDSDTPMPTLQV